MNEKAVISNSEEATVNFLDSEKLQKLDYDYEWILNENLLRDEGALYGLSDSPVKEKIATIYNYYDQKVALKKAVGENLRQEEESLLQKNIDLAIDIELVKKKFEVLSSNAYFKEHALPRSLTRIVFYLLIILSSFWMVYEWTGSLWNFSFLATLGTYCMGALSLYNHQSVVYQKDADQIPSFRETWKMIIEEYVVPLITTLFIISWQAKQANLFQTISFGLFLYVLFILAGRGLLSGILALRDDYLVWQNNRRSNEFRKLEIDNTIVEIKKLEDNIEKNISKLDQLGIDKAKNSEAIAIFGSEAEAKVAYFKSEFHLAQQARSIITNEQRIQIGLPQKHNS